MPEAEEQTAEQLRKENAQLRAQLDEAQQLIEALKQGEVDALIIDGSGGERLQALDGAEKVYRQLVEDMSEGAFTLDSEGLILYANRRFAEMLKTPLEKLTGSNIDNWCTKGNRTALLNFLQAAETSDSGRRSEFVLKASDGAPIPILLSLNKMPGDGGTTHFSLIATDLSEQKHNEAIAADERLARSILEQATDAIVVCDQSGWIIRASRAAQQLCACQPIGLQFEHCFPLEDDNGKPVTLESLLAESGMQGSELWFSRSHNQYQLQVSAARITGSGEHPLGTVVTLNDVTKIKEAERDALNARNEVKAQLEQSNRARLSLLSVVEDQKLTEQALRNSEAHFRLALGNLPIAVWNMDTALRYVWHYEHEHGDTQKSITGKTDHDLYAPEDADYITKLKRRVLKSGKAINKEIYATFNGQKKFFNLYIEPLRDKMDQITGLSGATVDITDIRELEFEREKLAAALKQSAIAMGMFDTDLNFEYINQAFTGLFGFTQEELEGKSVSLITSSKTAPGMTPMQVRDIAQKEGIFRGEVTRKTKDGNLIPVYITAAPLVNEDGKTTGFVASFNDLRPLKESEKRLQDALTDTITAISHTIEKRDPYTAGHQQRVAELAVVIAQEMGFDSKQVEGIYLGSLIHDIGKIYIPSEILNRPGKLSSYEFGLIKSHPEVGYEIIKDVKFDWPISDMVYQHHERIDGSGYPQGLKGDEICIEAKIVAVADIVEAMTSHRPYRPGLGIEPALKQIEQEAGTTLDREIVNCCLQLFRKDHFNWSSEFTAAK